MDFNTFVTLLGSGQLQFESSTLSLKTIRTLYKERIDSNATQYSIAQKINSREANIANAESGRRSFEGLSHVFLNEYWEMYKTLDPVGTALPDY